MPPTSPSDETQELDGEYLRDNAREVALMDQANRRNLILKAFAVAKAACDASLVSFEHMQDATTTTADLDEWEAIKQLTLELCDRSVKACDAVSNLLNSQREIR